LPLAVLKPGAQHGYAVIEAVRAPSGGTLDLPTGTVYPTLHRLERAGSISSDWETVAGRRRAYLPTPAGEAALAEPWCWRPSATFGPATMTPVFEARRCTRIGSADGRGGDPARAGRAVVHVLGLLACREVLRGDH
jgi:DNA-binding PadR family transcriptional regulator